jgi:hypothetical protein
MMAVGRLTVLAVALSTLAALSNAHAEILIGVADRLRTVRLVRLDRRQVRAQGFDRLIAAACP